MNEIKKQQKIVDGIQTEISRITYELQKIQDNTSGITPDDISNLTQNVSALQTSLNFLQSTYNSIKTELDTISNLNLEETLNSINTSITNLISQMEEIKIPQDPNKLQGADFTDYDPGVVLKGYDCYERNLNYSSTSNPIYLPPICFAVVEGSTASINFSFKFTVKTTLSNLLFRLYLNNEIVYEEAYIPNDLEQEISKTIELNSMLLSQRGNTFCAYIGKGNNQTEILVSYYKFEIIAPNADIINKLRPASINYFGTDYIIDDCTSGKILTTTANPSTFLRLSDLYFTDTQIEAQHTSRTFTTQAIGNSYILNEPILTYSSNENKIITLNESGGNSINFYNYYSADLLDYVTSSSSNIRIYVASYNISNGQMRGAMYYYPSNFSSGSVYYVSYLSEIASIATIKRFDDFTNEANTYAVIFTTNEGQNYYYSVFTSSTSPNINIGYGKNVIAYYYDFVSANNYKFEVYLNVYGKIICKKYSLLNNQVTLISSTEVGNYDYYFKGINNDYFVVKDNVLTFYKADWLIFLLIKNKIK